MWSRLLVLALLLPAQALAGTKEEVATLAPSGLVLVMDAQGKELIVGVDDGKHNVLMGFGWKQRRLPCLCLVSKKGGGVCEARRLALLSDQATFLRAVLSAGWGTMRR